MNVTAPELQVTGRYPDCARTYSKGTVGGGQGSSAPQPVTEDQGGELCANTQTHVMLAKMVLKVAGLSRYRALENTAKCPFYIAHGTRCDTNAECNMAFRQGFGGLFGNQRDSQVTNIQNCFSKY